MTIHISGILSSDPALNEADIPCNEPTAVTLKSIDNGDYSSPLKAAFDEFVCDWLSSKFGIAPRAFKWELREEMEKCA